MPEVSVVIPAFEREMTLGRALASVVSQSFEEHGHPRSAGADYRVFGFRRRVVAQQAGGAT